MEWFKNLFAPKEKPELWYGDRNYIRFEQFNFKEGSLMEANVVFISDRGNRKIVSVSANDSVDAIANLNRLVVESPNLFWQDEVNDG